MRGIHFLTDRETHMEKMFWMAEDSMPLSFLRDQVRAGNPQTTFTKD